MKIILAQGNPGLQYAKTRHNIGWTILDEFALANTVSFSKKSKLFSEIGEYTIEDTKVLLVKPDTFYNETGRALAAITNFFKVDSSGILVLHDDLALPFGKIRVRKQGSDGGNNGIKSINSHIGPNYTRIRIGISTEQKATMGDSNFVLSKLTASEQADLKKYITPKVVELLHHFVTAGDLDEESMQLIPLLATSQD